MTQPMQRLSDLSDHHPRGRIVTKAAKNHALSDHPTTSDRKVESDGKKQGWSPAAWGARRHAASTEKEVAARITFYLAAMADAAEALAEPDIELDAERAVMAAHRYSAKGCGQ